MITLYGCQSAGSLLMDLFSVESVLHFTTAAILSSLSVIPLSMTRSKDPKLEEPDALSIYNLYKISPTGVLGCFSSGMITGSIYGLHPYFLRVINFEPSKVALIMFATVFGAGFMQYPVGRFSDSFDRRRVMIIMALLSGVCSLIISFTDPNFLGTTILMSFFLGGFCFTLYPISINHACDSIDSKAILSATQGLLFAYSIGSSFGPLISSAFMRIAGPRGMFIFFMILTAALAFFFQWRSRLRPIEESEKQDFVNVTSTTPVGVQIERKESEDN
jgi:MFS family permease